jgi:HYR domain
MKRQVVIGLVAIAAAAAHQAATAAGSGLRAAGDLSLSATVAVRYHFGDYCAPGTPEDALCVRFSGTALVRGLGRTSITYDKTVREASACQVRQFRTAVLDVEGKGTIELTMPREACGPTAPASVGPLDLIVTGGSGAYARAAGSVRFSSVVYRPDLACGPCGRGRDTWAGAISVPGLEFDLDPPTLTGTSARVVRVPKGSARVRVRYEVSARDAVDGAVPTTCTPSSGRYFRIGRTTVTCSATDSSANTRRARFAITVRR